MRLLPFVVPPPPTHTHYSRLKESLRAVMRAQALEKESFEATLKQKVRPLLLLCALRARHGYIRQELEGKIAELKFEEKFRAGTEHILEVWFQ